MVGQQTILLPPVKGVVHDCDGIFSRDDHFTVAKLSMMEEI